MSDLIEIKVPDIGDFDNVPIIEIFVNIGDIIAKEDLLLALESDKATMEVPSDSTGVVREVLVKVGDHVSQGQVILKLESNENTKPENESAPTTENNALTEEKAQPVTVDNTVSSDSDHSADLVVLGSGPGGYTAAFRAADLGLNVILIERYDVIGGVCLNVGCIPSKALLHVAEVITESEEADVLGLSYAKPKMDINKTRDWKNSIIKQLTGGLTGLAKKRNVTVIHGLGEFSAPNQITVTNEKGTETVGFKQAIIAVGSEPIKISGFPHDDSRLIDSTGALELDDIPKSLLIVGGGIIGLEMATVYHALGTKVSIVEMMDGIMAGADKDMVRPLLKRIKGQYENIWTGTKVTDIKALKTKLKVSFEGKNAPESESFDKVLIAVGRKSNANKVNLEAAGLKPNERGFIDVDNQMRTSVSNIFAIGDVVGQPMLAHKAVHEGKVAAEVAAGHKSGFDARVIPSVAYTNPEVAWVGVTETEAKEQNITYEKGAFPWAASGRSLSQGRSEGVTKLLFDPKTDRIIGGAVTGANAGDLIAEIALAIEMNADAQDISLTIHAHPTLAETIGFAAEAFEGTITDLYIPKKKY